MNAREALETRLRAVANECSESCKNVEAAEVEKEKLMTDVEKLEAEKEKALKEHKTITRIS
jgi:hypothetical protein